MFPNWGMGVEAPLNRGPAGPLFKGASIENQGAAAPCTPAMGHPDFSQGAAASCTPAF